MFDKKTDLSCCNTRGRQDSGNSSDEILVRLKILLALEFFKTGLLIGLICYVKAV